MQNSPDRIEPTENKRTFGDLNAEAPLWILIPKAFFAITASAALLLLIFWLNFGELNWFAVSFAIFLCVFQILLIVGLRFRDRTDVHAEKPLQNDWIDKIGAWWLVACAFGVLFGWGIVKTAAFFPGIDSVYFHAARVFLTIFLPILTMLPNVRYVGRNSAHIQIPMLFGITLLPILSGLGSLFEVLKRLNF